MIGKQTTLDLNGPILSFIQQPQSVSVDNGSTVIFTGIATAFFPTQDPPNPASNTGTLSYRWSAEGFGPLTDGTFQGASITGSGTTILTVSNVKSPDTNQTNFFLSVDYTPSAYSQPVGSAVTVGTGRSTGNAVNEILGSNNATLTVRPFITITSQPIDTTVAFGRQALFDVDATLSDDRFGSLSYQWKLDNQNLSDGSLVQGSREKRLTLTASPPLIKPILSAPVCISVIDESSPISTTIRNDWLSFRSNYPNRNFWLLQPGGTITDLKIPAEYAADSKANYSQVARDNGNTFSRSDWFMICNLGSYSTGTVVSLAIDTSGSLRLLAVRASYDLFKQKCAQAGLVLVEATLNDERWAPPHNKVLPESTAVGGSYNINAIVSNPNAQSIISNTVNFNIVSAREIINFESVNDDGGFTGSGSINLFNNPTTFTADLNNLERSLVIYPSEKDIRVRITLAAGAGASRGSRGGEGGLSVFEYVLRQNTEYVFKLGAATAPTGGSNGGGGAAYLYEKARLIAVCGGGGGSGTVSSGGDGGGIGVGGEFGQGRNGGAGGRRVDNGALPTVSGSLASGSSGGQVSGCTIGRYYASIGFSPCQDVGQQKWRAAAFPGTITSQTAIIQRGYKQGLGFRNNGGNGSGNQGGGGSGAYGGNAAVADGSGGGGGSGYTDGSINVINTQLGGNSSTSAFAKIEAIV